MLGIRIRKRNIETCLLIILLAIVSEYKVPHQVMLQKIVYVLFGIYACVTMLKGPRQITNKKARDTIIFSAIPVIGVVIYTCFVCVFTGSLDVMIQAGSTSAYILIDMLMAFSLFILYKTEAINIIYYSTVLSYCLAVIIAIVNLGLHGAYVDFLNGITGLNSQIERNDIGTSVVLLILYFLINLEDVENHVKRVYHKRIVILLLILFLSGKRSALVGIAVGLIIYIIYKVRIKITRKTLFVVSSLTLMILFFYVGLIQTGWLSFFAEKMGINSMGRLYVWSWFNSMYSLSPTYLGKGFQFVHIFMQNFTEDGMVHDFGYLHNSILQLYIELGFYGFLGYFFFYLYNLPIKIWKIYGKKSMYFFMCIYMCSVAIYLTDNVLTYPIYQMTLFSCLLSFGGKEYERGKNQLCSSYL